MENENLLRPNKLDDFFGQDFIVSNLKVFIFSAKKRKTVLNHLLFYGPPGLGKTSLANVIANEMNARLITISGPILKDPTELISILATINEGDILFIDEIHRMAKNVEEVLYSAMEDFKINIPYKSEENCKVLDVSLPPFTLIGATTNAGLISKPLRDRFNTLFNFKFYNDDEIAKIIDCNVKKLDFNIDENSIKILSKKSRMTPRVANNLIKKIYDYSIYKNIKIINEIDLKQAFDFFNIKEFGLYESDIEILKILHSNLKDEPASLETISSIINENPENLREVNEPYLLYLGLIERTKRGRKITKKGIEVLFKITRNLY